MALPHNFRLLGIIPGTLLLLGAYLCTHLSMDLLCRCVMRLSHAPPPLRRRHRSSTASCGRMDFKAVIGACLGPRTVLATQIAIILNNIGLCVVYLIIVGDVLVGSSSDPGLLRPFPLLNNKFFSVGGVTLLLVTPLCMLRRVDSLKFTSAASMALSFIFIIVTFVLLFIRLGGRGTGPVNWWPERGASPAEILKTLPVFVTAYICHYNLHPIFSEMAAPTAARMAFVVRAALWSTTSVYWLVALSAYLLFTQRTAPDVLLNYGDAGLSGAAARGVEVLVKVAYALSLVGTFPLIQIALRQSLFDLLGWGPAGEAPRRFVGITAGLLGLEYLLALVVPDISTAFGVMGSTVSVWIGFIVPSLCAVKCRGSSRRDALLGRGLFVGGVVLGVVSFAATCVGMATKEKAPPPPPPAPI